MADKNFKIREGIEVTEEVLETISGIAALEVEGASALHGNITSKNIYKSGKNKIRRAVNVLSNDENTVSVRLSISIKYGYSVMDVTKKIQEKVKNSVESTTDLKVNSVDVKVSSVQMN